MKATKTYSINEYKEICGLGIRSMFLLGSYEVLDALDNDEVMHYLVNDRESVEYHEVSLEDAYTLVSTYLSGIHKRPEDTKITLMEYLDEIAGKKLPLQPRRVK